MPVSVQICFQAEGLFFERSESKTYIISKMLHILKKISQKSVFRTKRYVELLLENSMCIFGRSISISDLRATGAKAIR